MNYRKHIRTEKERIGDRARNKRAVERWHGQTLLNYYPIVIKGRIGEAIAEAWLAKFGFKDIIQLSKIYYLSAFDFAATYNGERVVIDSTVAHYKSLLTKKYKLAQALGLRFFVLHVSLNGVRGILHEVKAGQEYSVVLKSELKTSEEIT